MINKISFLQRRIAASVLMTFALITGAFTFLVTPGEAAIKVNERAPEFALKDSNGTLRTLSKMRGHVVVLEWLNYGCPYVRKFYDSHTMQAMQKTATANDVIWLSVISSAPGKQGHLEAGDVAHHSKHFGASPTGVILDPDGTLGRLYGAKVTPHLYVIDQEGILRYMGGIDSIRSTDPEDIKEADPYVINAIEALLNEKSPDPAVTRPYGCSVKYDKKL